MLEQALSQTLWHLAAEGFLVVTLGDAGPFTHGVRWRRCLVVFANEPDPSPEQIRAWVKVWGAQSVEGVQQILVAGFGPARDEPGYLALDLTQRTVTGKAPRGLLKGLRQALARFDPADPADFSRLDQLQAETEVALSQLRARKPWVTYATIAACAAMYALTLATGGPDDNWTMFRWGADYPATEHAGQVWRWGSAMFLHFSWLHIGLNMYSLYILGRTLERVLGARQFAGLYAAGGLAGGAASLLMAPPNGLSAGASGAIFGLFGAGLWLEWKGHPRLPGPLRKGLVGGMGPVILANLAIGFSTSFINNAAHLGGLVGGALCLASRLRGWPAAALGLVPPLALGWALAQGARYPTPVTYPTQTIGEGWEVPAFLTPRTVEGRPLWVGLGYACSEVSWKPDPPPNFHEPAQVAAFLKQEDLQPAAQEVTPTGWLLLRLDFPDGVSWAAVGGQGRLLRVDTQLQNGEEAKALLLRGVGAP